MKTYLYLPQGPEALRKELPGIRRAQFRRLCEQCRLYEKESLPTEHPLKSITYFGMAAANLSLAFLLTSQPQYLSEARRWLSQGVTFPHWGRAVKVDVDLSAAWLLFGFGLSYDWLGESLPPQERDALRKKLILQGERMYEFAVSGQDGWPSHYWQNHNWIDFTGLAAAGYALQGEYPPARRWTQAALENMRTVFPLLPQDGSDCEGVAYWRYGVIWLALYAELAREKEGVDLFAGSGFLKNTFWYRLYQSAPDLARTFPFGDCHDSLSGHSAALYYKLASEYRIGCAQRLARLVLETMLWREGYESGIKPGILPEAFLELLWYDPSVKESDLNALPKEAFFPDLGLYSLRTGWGPDAQAFSFKCSSGGGHRQWETVFGLEEKTGRRIRSMGHHHPDANSFLLLHGNDCLVTDDGYSGKKAACHHNLLLADGRGYEGDGAYDIYECLSSGRTARVEAYEQREGFRYLRGESSRLYERALRLTRYQREVLCAEHGYFVICDGVAAEIPHRYAALYHFEVPGRLSGSDCTVENGESRLLLHTASPAVLSLREDTVSANPTSQEPGLILTHRMHVLWAETELPAKEARLLTVLFPQFLWETPARCKTVRTSWGEAVLVSGPDFTDCVLHNISGGPVRGLLEIDGFSFSAALDGAWKIVSLS